MVLIVLIILFGPPAAFTFIGLEQRKLFPKKAKANFIAAIVYLIIGLGTCGSMLYG